MDKRKTRLHVIVGIVIVILLTVAFSIPFIKHINDSQKLRDLINSFGALAPLAFIIVSMIQILIPFIPGEPFELLAGYIFGTLKGSILCLISGCIASIVIIILVKKYEEKILHFFFKKTEINKVKFLKSKKSFILYSIVFIMPGTPKDLLCYLGGLSKYDLIPLLIVVTIGRIPSIITSTIPADALGDKKYTFAIISYCIAALICLTGFIIYNKIIKRRESRRKKVS